MYKFYCDKLIDGYFELDEETQKHLKVVRIKNESFLINYQNQFYECIWKFPSKAKIIKKMDINNEVGFEITVAIPIIKQTNFEIAIQKATELGATKIIPFISKFCDSQNLKSISNQNRILKIIKEAAQQSFRNKIPELTELISFDQLIKLNVKSKILAYENKKESPINKTNENVLLIVGPEGGFSIDEIDMASKANVKIVSLTRTILRAETALIYMLAKIN
ncbi:16S rRNA (uracil(1498)-N(3))-methyltransferase [Metamycoplasma equirhinis]|uniref:16S rRNA (uracil(1498)-N(3))-methyltransferase n=1 Tax=Metamycoplasma equirhinis TaxID=92402 RepID=UPI00359C9576